MSSGCSSEPLLNRQIESAAGADYLRARDKELHSRGVRTRSEIVRGDAAREIANAARRLSADLIVMGTHGRAGAEAFWTGSVAARVVERTRTPLLLLPLDATDAAVPPRSETSGPGAGS